MRKPVTLIAGQFGSSHFGTRPYLEAAVALTRKEAPSALYIGAASGDDESFGKALCALLAAAGAAAPVAWPKLSARRPARAAVRAQLERVDFVFIGGGDVEAGMDALRDADLIGDLQGAAARGAVFAGMSAGAIMLGRRWIRWPTEDAGDDEAETYECLGLAPCSLDTHGEGARWNEARSFAKVRARETGRKAKALGVPSGGALTVTSSGRMRARGRPVPLFAAASRGPVKIEATLPVEP